MAIASVQQAAFGDHNIQYQFRTENNGGQVRRRQPPPLPPEVRPSAVQMRGGGGNPGLAWPGPSRPPQAWLPGPGQLPIDARTTLPPSAGDIPRSPGDRRSAGRPGRHGGRCERRVHRRLRRGAAGCDPGGCGWGGPAPRPRCRLCAPRPRSTLPTGRCPARPPGNEDGGHPPAGRVPREGAGGAQRLSSAPAAQSPLVLVTPWTTALEHHFSLFFFNPHQNGRVGKGSLVEVIAPELALSSCLRPRTLERHPEGLPHTSTATWGWVGAPRWLNPPTPCLPTGRHTEPLQQWRQPSG